MSYKPRSRKRSKLVDRRQVGAIIAVVLLAAGAWYAYQTYVVKPPPVYGTVNTSLGSFEIELFPASAPRTVANFVNLAQSGFYDNLVWQRIVVGFVIQTGDPQTRNGGGNRSAWGQGPSTTFPLEIDSSLHNYQGYIAMAGLDNVDGVTSQFYINLKNTSSNLSLDGNYTVFGRVISGWDVVTAISNTPVYTTAKYFSQPITPVFVTSIVITRTP